MLRRISTIAAATAMLAISAIPASAATAQSSTHKISFPGLHGVSAWGTYTKSGSKVRVNVCAEDTDHGKFAVGAVTLAYNSSNTKHDELGAVSIGYHETVCRSESLLYTGHLRVYTFVAGNQGKITGKSSIKTIY